MNLPWAQHVQPSADVALAGTVALVGVLTVAGSSPLSLGGATSLVGPHAALAVSYVFAGAVLVFRRYRPLAGLVAVSIALAIPFALFGASEGFSAIAPVFIALYSVGAHAKVSRVLAAFGIYVGFWTLLELRNPLNPDVHSALGSWPLFLVGIMLLLFGAFLRTRRLYIDELRDRAEFAEAEREERVRVATADERARIARELHDAVAHAMTVMVMQAEAADEVLETDLARGRAAIQQVQRVGREGLSEMRRLLGVLRQDSTPPFAPQPGIAALDALIADVSATGLTATLTVVGEPLSVSTGVDISAYRIVQEALTNVIKHAHARSVAIRLGYRSDELAIEIADDGVGFSSASERGHGLIGMQERVDLYGGTFRAGAVPGGFSVRATLPIERRP
jgi:signal transduction histidine kinase